MPGPPPKRSDQRRRRNQPEKEITEVPGAETVTIPDADPDWHPIARRWYESLGRSGQSQFYQESDWMSAVVTAESMSRELKPQPILVGKGEDAHVEMHEQPPKSASIAAWSRVFTALLATEGDRRRVSLELSRPAEGKEDNPADVARFEDYKLRLKEPS